MEKDGWGGVTHDNLAWCHHHTFVMTEMDCTLFLLLFKVWIWAKGWDLFDLAILKEWQKKGLFP